MSSLRNARRLWGGAGLLALAWLVSCQVDKLFQDLWSNDDARKNTVAASVMKGEHTLLSDGIVNLDFEYKTHFLSAPRPEHGAGTVAAAGS